MIAYLGPWVWNDGALPGWQSPEGVVAAVDLRPLPQQGPPTGTPGIGLFLSPVALSGDYVRLGDGMDDLATAKVKAAWRSLTGHQPQGGTVTDLLWDHLTRGSDIEGLAGPKPLMPGRTGRQQWMDLHLGGRLRSQPFAWGATGHAGRVRDALRREFRTLHADAEGGKLRDREHHRRVLDLWCEEYGVDDWREFVPADLRPHIPGRLKHETTYTESFNKANSDTLGPDLTWTETAGDIDVVSNQAQTQNVGENMARAEADLSSADHYADIDLHTLVSIEAAGPNVRMATGSNPNCYFGRSHAGNARWELYKRVGGGYTVLGTANTGWALPAGATLRVQANGSSIQLLQSGSTKISSTDTAITGNLRCGIHGWNGGHVMDSFVASDGAAAGLLYTQLERGTRGLTRGVYGGSL